MAFLGVLLAAMVHPRTAGGFPGTLVWMKNRLERKVPLKALKSISSRSSFGMAHTMLWKPSLHHVRAFEVRGPGAASAQGCSDL